MDRLGYEPDLGYDAADVKNPTYLDRLLDAAEDEL